MLALGRALMHSPKLLLLDEPSLGLAPLMVDRVFDRITEIKKDEGTSMLLVEQHVSAALLLASRAYVLQAGRIALQGSSETLRRDATVVGAYLGESMEQGGPAVTNSW